MTYSKDQIPTRAESIQFRMMRIRRNKKGIRKIKTVAQAKDGDTVQIPTRNIKISRQQRKRMSKKKRSKTYKDQRKNKYINQE